MTPLDRRVRAAALVLAVMTAAYVGFRMPSRWTATLDAVSLLDGFHRRFVVGTVLRPLAVVTGYSYWVFAGTSLVVLALLLAVMARAALRARVRSQYLLVVAFLVAPAGGFLFYEVGYFDQLVYLMLFGSVALLRHGRVALAVAAMSLTPCVHEISLATVLPLFGLVALRELPLRRAIVVTAIPTAINLFLLALPPTSAEAVADLTARLHGANFECRWDALDLFRHTQAEARAMYDAHEVLLYVMPIAILLVAGFIALWAANRGFARPERGRPRSIGILAASCIAIVTPALLAFGGFDSNRWLFLTLCNFLAVAWYSLDGEPRELRATPIAVLAVMVLLVTRVPIFHFDGLQPRTMTGRSVGELVEQIRNGSLIAIPPATAG